jgi:hypothetical protein
MIDYKLVRERFNVWTHTIWVNNKTIDWNIQKFYYIDEHKDYFLEHDLDKNTDHSEDTYKNKIEGYMRMTLEDLKTKFKLLDTVKKFKSLEENKIKIGSIEYKVFNVNNDMDRPPLRNFEDLYPKVNIDGTIYRTRGIGSFMIQNYEAGRPLSIAVYED